MSEKYLKNRDYTLRGGKEAQITNNRQRMAETQHSESDSFVKAEQAKTKKYAGRAPIMEERFYEFNANMMNNGEHAQRLAKEMTAGIDHDAFPVRQKPDDMQD
jgi:hypothetical protein